MSLVQTVASTFSVLRIRNLRIYLGGQAISLIGTWLQVTAQGWVVWKLTGSTVDLGVVSMLGSLPLLVLGPWTGAWADRFNRRKVLIYSQAGAMLLAFILSFLVLTNSVQIWHVYALALALGVITAIDMPAQQAFIGELAGTSEVRRAVNVNVMILQVSRTLGPALAGLVIGVVGPGIAFFLNGLSFLAVIYSLLKVKAVTTSNNPNATSALRGFREALGFVSSQPRLVSLYMYGILMTFFAFSIVLNILPAVADEVLRGDASLLGALMSSSGAGALLGVIVLAPWVQSLRRTGVALSVATMLAALCFALLGASNIVLLSMAALFLAGLAVPSVMTTGMGLLQFNTPPQMRARVMGLFSMVSFGMQPLAALWIGWAGEHFGIQQAILINSVCLLIGGTLMLTRASLLATDAVPVNTVVATPAELSGD